MTDKEVIKALELCANLEECKDCPMANMQKYDTDTCEHQIMLYALDLINRQKAEIERLKGMVSQNEGVLPRYEQLIKAEAIKEFAEKVCNEITDAIISNGKVIKERVEKHNVNRLEDNFCCMCDGKIRALGGIEYFIKNLLKEMVGDNCGV